MRTKGVLPIPFLILILAGIIALCMVVADRGAGAAIVRDDSPRVQMIEQQRAAEYYFRVLSWLSDLTARPAKPANTHPQPTPHVVKSPRQRLGRIEFCRLALGSNSTPSKTCPHSLD